MARLLVFFSQLQNLAKVAFPLLREVFAWQLPRHGRFARNSRPQPFSQYQNWHTSPVGWQNHSMVRISDPIGLRQFEAGFLEADDQQPKIVGVSAAALFIFSSNALLSADDWSKTVEQMWHSDTFLMKHLEHTESLQGRGVFVGWLTRCFCLTTKATLNYENLQLIQIK